jgi:hypothetical protein
MTYSLTALPGKVQHTDECDVCQNFDQNFAQKIMITQLQHFALKS